MTEATAGGPVVRVVRPDEQVDVARVFAVIGGDISPGDPRLAGAFQEFESHDGTTLVAEIDGSVVGALSFFVRRFSPTDAGATLWIDSLAVDERYRGRGAGRALMDETLRQAAASGCTTVLVHTHEEMVEALSLYTSLGFERHGLYLQLPLA